MNITKKPSIIFDSIKQPYMVFEFEYHEISDLIELFRNNVTNFPALEEYKKNRDGKKYHMTILSSPEYGKLNKDPLNAQKIKDLLTKEFEISIQGVGHIQVKEPEAYFGVVSAPGLNNIRKELSLNNKDFHITLGFHLKDVHFDEYKKAVDKHTILWPLDNQLSNNLQKKIKLEF